MISFRWHPDLRQCVCADVQSTSALPLKATSGQTCVPFENTQRVQNQLIEPIEDCCINSSDHHMMLSQVDCSRKQGFYERAAHTSTNVRAGGQWIQPHSGNPPMPLSDVRMRRSRERRCSQESSRQVHRKTCPGQAVTDSCETSIRVGEVPKADIALRLARRVTPKPFCPGSKAESDPYPHRCTCGLL
jgi:hypothetical protein